MGKSPGTVIPGTGQSRQVPTPAFPRFNFFSKQHLSIQLFNFLSSRLKYFKNEKKRNFNFLFAIIWSFFYWFLTKSQFYNQLILGLWAVNWQPIWARNSKLKKKNFKFLNCYISTIFLMILNLKTFSESVDYKLSIDTPFEHDIQNFEKTILIFFSFLFKIFLKTTKRLSLKNLLRSDCLLRGIWAVPMTVYLCRI